MFLFAREIRILVRGIICTGGVNNSEIDSRAFDHSSLVLEAIRAFLNTTKIFSSVVT